MWIQWWFQQIIILLCSSKSGLGLLASAHFCTSHFRVTWLPLSSVKSPTVRLIYSSPGSSDPKENHEWDKWKDSRTGKFAKTCFLILSWNCKEEKMIYIGFQKAVSSLKFYLCTISDFHICGPFKEGMMISHPHMVHTFFLKVYFSRFNSSWQKGRTIEGFSLFWSAMIYKKAVI